MGQKHGQYFWFKLYITKQTSPQNDKTVGFNSLWNKTMTLRPAHWADHLTVEPPFAKLFN